MKKWKKIIFGLAHLTVYLLVAYSYGIQAAILLLLAMTFNNVERKQDLIKIKEEIFLILKHFYQPK